MDAGFSTFFATSLATATSDRLTVTALGVACEASAYHARPLGRLAASYQI